MHVMRPTNACKGAYSAFCLQGQEARGCASEARVLVQERRRRGYQDWHPAEAQVGCSA
jgi:hypothetical protein